MPFNNRSMKLQSMPALLVGFEYDLWNAQYPWLIRISFSLHYREIKDCSTNVNYKLVEPAQLFTTSVVGAMMDAYPRAIFLFQPENWFSVGVGFGIFYRNVDWDFEDLWQGSQSINPGKVGYFNLQTLLLTPGMELQISPWPWFTIKIFYNHKLSQLNVVNTAEFKYMDLEMEWIWDASDCMELGIFLEIRLTNNLSLGGLVTSDWFKTSTYRIESSTLPNISKKEDNAQIDIHNMGYSFGFVVHF